jgi:diketogulonate reductase-like aldo/keto reductase
MTATMGLFVNTADAAESSKEFTTEYLTENIKKSRMETPESARMNTRPIPATGEALPVIGCGTWIGFDVVADTAQYQRLPGVLDALVRAGGSVIDSSPMYGRAEAVVGELIVATPSLRKQSFLATKVWTSGRDAGIAQMERSISLMKAGTMDLMQIHNLVDWRTHLATLRQWQEAGRIRYIGLTHYTSSAYRDLEAAMRSAKPDFVQLNYSIDDRAAEQRLLPLARELGIAVLVNMPFGGGGLLRSLAAVPLPGWAPEVGCQSWAQVLLKFVISHPAVTCAIPGTSRAEHMAQNAAAGSGVMFDEAMRLRVLKDWQAR